MTIKIVLKPVTVNNWKACIALELAPDQQHFVPSNLYSIADAQFYPDAKSRAICDEKKQLVGYALFGCDVLTQKWKIFRIMIDQSHQQKGYGTAAMKEIIKTIFEEPDCSDILICYQDLNQVARRLYASLGFVEQQISSDGKVTAMLEMKSIAG